MPDFRSAGFVGGTRNVSNHLSPQIGDPGDLFDRDISKHEADETGTSYESSRIKIEGGSINTAGPKPQTLARNSDYILSFTNKSLLATVSPTATGSSAMIPSAGA